MRRSAPYITTLVLGLSTMTAAPLPATAQEGRMRDAPSLLDTLALWLEANFDLPRAARDPRLVTLPSSELVAMRYGVGASVAPDRVVALYEETTGTIYLSDGWTGHSPAELSILVHELVHHMQAMAGHRFACPAARERLAYRAQDAWLALFGEDLETAFNLDPAMLLVGTVCTH
ncbi:DUF6647 family protein [Limimaricola pyoseonensis]|uniref:DUF6647 domain-containing protein n=1 Tax=Limimaricola pyoseonensis TaxID=521013 RepID=A0A1G7K4I6_9RHOB|nr:DUF6647 family protein [Limimaricola pyoseonensis]SDF32046.1 hypothetical protein SAMN04488567_0119 [Limimaricola pyoseonensis]